MKTVYVNQLQPNQDVETIFLVHVKELRTRRTGEPYLMLVLGDRTGQVDARVWDNVTEIAATFEVEDFVRVRGIYQLHNNRPQLNVQSLIRVDESTVNLADFLPTATRNPDEMFQQLLGYIGIVRNPHLKALLDAVFQDEEIARRFRMVPAARVLHHAYLGGLLEHVLSLCWLAKALCHRYPHLDQDLLLTGVILHDLGKIYELKYQRTFGYTSEGRLLGHIVLGLRLIEEKARQLPGFPPRLLDLVEHMILSHHGKPEFGSPKEPMFPEALALHFLDDLDSKMEAMKQALQKPAGYTEPEWTEYVPALQRHVLRVEEFLKQESQQAEQPPAEVFGEDPGRSNTTSFKSQPLLYEKLAKIFPEWESK